MGNYTESGVLNALRRINGITIDANNKIVKVKSDVAGNATWGKIQFLTKYCGYTHDIVKAKAEYAEDNFIIIHTPVEREKFTKHKVKP